MKKIAILVIDDEERMCSLLGRYLSAAGFAVTLRHRLPHANELAGMVVDLVIVDWLLDGASGLEWVKGLRADPRHAALPIIMMSGRDSDEDRVRALENGPDDFMCKPLVLRELSARIANLLRRTRTLRLRYADPHLHIDVARRCLIVAGNPETPSDREWALLAALLQEKEPLSRQELIHAIWADAPDSGKRLDMLVRRLRERIERNPKHPDYLLSVRGVGYQFAAAD